ncbi:MAG: VOC family protein [Porticoccaceae bacterium]
MTVETTPDGTARHPPGGIRLISAVTLTASDMAASVAFYQTLGMTIRYGGSTALFTSLHAGACYINLIAKPAMTPGFWGRIIFHVEDVDAIYQQLLAQGYVGETAPADASWGERYFHIRDPSGHELSIAKSLAAV